MNLPYLALCKISCPDVIRKKERFQPHFQLLGSDFKSNSSDGDPQVQTLARVMSAPLKITIRSSGTIAFLPS
jgi:hypothetical protein